MRQEAGYTRPWRRGRFYLLGMMNMKLVLHIGPHKTGTTSLQTVMCQTFAKPKSKSLWYPPPPEFGPGHAALAWEIIGEPDPQGPMTLLEQALADGEKARVSTLMLSSEELSRVPENRLHVLHKLLGGIKLELVVTLSPFKRRIVSEWQELVKHRWKDDLEDSVPKMLAERPGLGTEFLRAYKNVLKPQRTWILVPPRGAFPVWLLNEFWRVLADIDPTLQPSPRWKSGTTLNPSLGAVEATLLLEMNRCFKRIRALDSSVTYMPFRQFFLDMFESRRWSETISRTPLKLSEKWLPLVEQHAEMQYQCIAEWAHASDVKVLGDLDAIRH